MPLFQFRCALLLAVAVARMYSSQDVTKPLIVSEDYDHVDNRPVIKVLKEGNFSRYEDESVEWQSSIVYIYDGPDCQIIVDTGLPSDTRAILRALAMNDILPTAVSLVVITSLQLDRVGNVNLFNYATYIVGTNAINGDVFTRLPTPLGEDAGEGEYEVRYLCPNVGLVGTKGHSVDDAFVLVYNASDYGNVTVTGDMFVCQDDITNGDIWRNVSMFPENQRQARRMIIAGSDYIIPGHGTGFKVTEEMRRVLHDQQPIDQPCACPIGSSFPTANFENMSMLAETLGALQNLSALMNSSLFTGLSSSNFSINTLPDLQNYSSVHPDMMMPPAQGESEPASPDVSNTGIPPQITPDTFLNGTNMTTQIGLTVGANASANVSAAQPLVPSAGAGNAETAPKAPDPGHE